MSPEILMILEADVVCVTEGSIHTTVSLNLRSWNIAGSSGTVRGDVSPAGSKTVAWYQTETMGTREAQYALLTELGVCAIKPIDGKIPQMVYWESDQLVVPSKQGNACGGKGLVQRSYLLVLWVQVPPLQFSVWQCSYTRQWLE
uniref:Uncharacterized protein n=1 Tax=Candidatus Methanophagaceae archaeon ANME-1 ERB6 TaxID=2759912 RepID=A0A7G9YU36_9EURY|nr:hypothetical protein CBNPKNJC_00035 [Methanosarcinales archaeon ANME-1 ERB6]